MNKSLNESLIKSVFRFRKVAMLFGGGTDLHMGELAVLTNIYHHGAGPGGNFCVSDLPNSLYVTKPAVSQILSALEKKGYISREIDPQDRRRFLMGLTASGEGAMKRAMDMTDRALGEVVRRFGEENAERFIELFNRFADIVEELKMDNG